MENDRRENTLEDISTMEKRTEKVVGLHLELYVATEMRSEDIIWAKKWNEHCEKIHGNFESKNNRNNNNNNNRFNSNAANEYVQLRGSLF